MQSKRSQESSRRPARFWPFGAVAAIVSALIILVFLSTAVIGAEHWTSWPGHSLESWVMLGVGVIALVPVVLLILDGMARSGGTLEVRGIKVAFAAIVHEQPNVVVPRNMGVPPGLPINDSGGRQVLEALRSFSRHDVVVVDLEDGLAWWETRLAVVCAGAARLGRQPRRRVGHGGRRRRSLPGLGTA